ncbi:MAG: ABC transporter permease [Microbacterium sp.]
MTITRPRRSRSSAASRTQISVAGWVAIGFLAVLVICAAAAPLLPIADPNAQSLSQRMLPPFSEGALFGTDELGRDILSRLVYGARVSLLVGLSAVLIGGVIGTVLGVLAGHYRGVVDDVISWLINVQLAFPFILLMIAVVAVLGPSLVNLIVVLGIGSWAVYARIARAEALSIGRRDYIAASRTLGVGDVRLLFRHVLPNVISPLIVIASFEVASMIVAEASMSFLGLGVGPDVPSWGSMISSGRQYMQSAWWLTTLPGLAIACAVLAVNVVGDSLRDRLDPRQRRRS